MIVDRLENAKLYTGLGHRIADALDYLAHTDLASLPDGKHPIDGDRLYVAVQRYQTKPPAEARWEFHRQYLDVQFVAAGAEAIGYAPWNDNLPIVQPYDPDKDLGFVAADGPLLPLTAGTFAIFAPQEIHAPCLALHGVSLNVLKLVVKSLWNG